MKFSFILMLMSLLQITAAVYSQTATITVSGRNVTISDVFKTIEEQTGYTVFYKNDQLDVNRHAGIQSGKITVKDALSQMFQDCDCGYTMFDKLIVVTPKNGMQQGITVTGTVVDNAGEPMPGVNIQVKGTITGVVTGVNGTYTISVPNENTVLVFSFVGYAMQEITVGNQRVIHVGLAETNRELEEVVVVGYGIQKKVNLTGAVSTVSSKAIDNRPVTSAVDAMQGILPGLTVQSASGQPGEFGSLKVRGNTSVNSGGALVLIDGLPGNINLVNPSDIESISVLKDAASAAIYGARAAEGVILITTKTGLSEKVKIEYNGNYSYNVPTRMPQLTSGLEHMEMANAAFVAAKMSPPFSEAALEARRTNSAVSIPDGAAWIFCADMDWIGKYMKNSSQQNHNLTISKAAPGLKYLFSAGWLGENGFFNKWTDDSYDRFNIRSNITVDLAKNLILDTKISYSVSTRKWPPPSNDAWSLQYMLFRQMGSTMPEFDENGHYARYRRQSNLRQQLDEGGEAYNKNRRGDAVASLNWTPVGGLKLSVLGGATLANQRQKTFKRTVERWGPLGLLEVAVGQGNPNAVQQFASNTAYLTGQFTADYKRSFGKHDLSVLGGTSWEQNDYEIINASRNDILGNIIPALNLGTTSINNDCTEEQWALFSYFARANYAYASKYLVEANFRSDASSRFSKKNRWGFFPSVSVGWRITEEDFMKGQKIFSNLKLRASWGQMGNQNGLGLYDHIAQYNINGYYPFAGSDARAQWALESRLPSEDRTWETVEVRNIALEMGFLNHRLNTTFEYFTKRNKDMLMNIAIPSTIGTAVPTGNYGELYTKGWEVSISWNDRAGDFRYYAGFNLSDQVDELVKYSNTNIVATYGGAGDGSNISDQYIQGYSLGAFFGFKTDGYFQTTDEAAAAPHINGNPNVTAGDIKYLSLSDNPATVSAPGDLAYIGNRVPRWVFGFNFGFQWHGWDFSALIQGVGKRDWYLGSDAIAPFVFEYGNISFKHQKDSWSPDNPNALLPRQCIGTNYNYLSSDHWIQNAAYARLKNLRIGYTLDQKWTKVAGIDRVNIYLSGENVCEISKMLKAYDPELTNAGGTMYPIMRNFSIGLNLTF